MKTWCAVKDTAFYVCIAVLIAARWFFCWITGREFNGLEY